MNDLELDKVPEKTSDDPLYDIVEGGYFPAETFSSDVDTQLKIKQAIRVMQQLLLHLEKHDLID